MNAQRASRGLDARQQTHQEHQSGRADQRVGDLLQLHFLPECDEQHEDSNPRGHAAADQ